MAHEVRESKRLTDEPSESYYLVRVRFNLRVIGIKSTTAFNNVTGVLSNSNSRDQSNKHGWKERQGRLPGERFRERTNSVYLEIC